MIKIKETKSVEMYYDEENQIIHIKLKNGDLHQNLHLPISKVFQVKRGLESAVQKFYRKHEKNKS